MTLWGAFSDALIMSIAFIGIVAVYMAVKLIIRAWDWLKEWLK